MLKMTKLRKLFRVATFENRQVVSVRVAENHRVGSPF